MIEKEVIEQLLTAGCSIQEIGRRLEVDPTTVSYWMKRHELVSPLSAKHGPKGGIPCETLTELVEAGLSVREIAERVGFGPASVRHWLKRHGLRTVRAREPFSAQPGERFMGTCRTHGETAFVVRNDGSRRCLRCRSEAVVRRRRLVKDTLVAEAGGRCAICGYDRYAGALEFHHLEPEAKEFAISLSGVTRSLERARQEARKCVLLCATCHAEVEGGVVAIDDRLATRDLESQVARSGVAQLADALDC